MNMKLIHFLKMDMCSNNFINVLRNTLFDNNVPFLIFNSKFVKLYKTINTITPSMEEKIST
jgi:hypothetical protein